MPSDERPRLLTRGIRVLRWLLAAVLVALAVRLIAADPAPLKMLGQMRVSTLAAMVVLVVLNHWLTAWRFKLAVKQCADVDVPVLEWFRLTSVAQFLSMFVPQLGHVYRAWALERQHRLAYRDYAVGVSVFFWFELLTGLALACAVVIVLAPGFRLGSVPVLAPLAFGLIVLFFGPGVAESMTRRLPLGQGWVSGLLRRVGASFTKARKSVADPAFILRYLGINLVVTAVHAALLWLAFDAVGARLGMGRIMLFQVLLKLTSFIMVTPGNIGLAELVYGVLADAASGGAQYGIAASLLIRGLTTPIMMVLGIALGGVSFLFHGGRRAEGR